MLCSYMFYRVDAPHNHSHIHGHGRVSRHSRGGLGARAAAAQRRGPAVRHRFLAGEPFATTAFICNKEGILRNHLIAYIYSTGWCSMSGVSCYVARAMGLATRVVRRDTKIPPARRRPRTPGAAAHSQCGVARSFRARVVEETHRQIKLSRPKLTDLLIPL